MNNEFYVNCIIEDRKSREFLDFSDEQWFKDFVKLNNKIKTEGENTLDCFFQMQELLQLAKNEEFKEKFSFSKEILDLLILIDISLLEYFLKSYKNYHFGSMEKNNQKQFPIVNLPLIRMMDYFLEKCAFEQFAYVMQRLEYQYIIIWFELTYERINKIIKENIDNPSLLFIFTKMPSEEITKFFKKENLCIIENAPHKALKMIFTETILPQDYVYNEYFFKAFKKLNLWQQVTLLELIDDKEYGTDMIKQLHSLLNKTTTFKKEMFVYNAFEMSEKRLKKLLDIIENSSYFSKNNVRNSDLWQILRPEYNYDIDLSHNYYSDIINLYHKCREYATTSIVNSLYPLNKLSGKVTHIRDKHYNILARVRTMWEVADLAETFEKRTFCSFSILTEKNMSHYGNGVLYGYFTDVSADMIAHISPIDSLSNASAEFESQLTEKMNKLLDIDDLNEATLKAKTYCQLCIKTKTKAGKILWTECIICIDKIDEKSQKTADELGLNIVVLHKSPDTIEQNEDIFAHLH